MSAEAPSKVAGLDRVLRPRSVAVLGASSRPGALSSRFISGLQRHGFGGRIVPVNPARDVIDGLPCAPSIEAASADEPIDLAVVSLPQSKVLTGIEECAAAGVGGAVIFSSGFSEVGEEGAAEERRITEVAHRTGLRVVGPNSPGLINRRGLDLRDRIGGRLQAVLRERRHLAARPVGWRGGPARRALAGRRRGPQRGRLHGQRGRPEGRRAALVARGARADEGRSASSSRASATRTPSRAGSTRCGRPASRSSC